MNVDNKVAVSPSRPLIGCAVRSLPEAFYQDDYVTIYNADCRDILLHFSSDCVIVSDPPYGINAEYSRAGTRKKVTLRGASANVYKCEQRPTIANDNKPFDPSHLLRFQIIALFGANHFADKLPASGKWFVWDKRKGTKSDYNSDAELIWTNQQGATRLFSHLWRGLVREGEENAVYGTKLHPAQKPVNLMKWILVQFKITPEQTVIDPYMGSGSTLKAAKDLGLKAVGIELSEEYCQIAKKRLMQNPLVF